MIRVETLLQTCVVERMTDSLQGVYVPRAFQVSDSAQSPNSDYVGVYLHILSFAISFIYLTIFPFE